MSPRIASLSTKKKLEFIQLLTCVFFAIGMFMSKNLWLENRNFPTLPLVDTLLFVPIYLDTALFYVTVGFLLFAVFLPQKTWLRCFFVLLIFLLIQDQMRWQPWVYIYFLVLIPFIVRQEKNRDGHILIYLQILFIGIYLWSGIHKFNPNFNEYIVEGFAQQLFNISNPETIALIKKSGFLFPVVETLAALFLLVPKIRKIGLIVLILMHLFIIIYVSPLGMNYNYIILPWNVFMILVSLLLFSNQKEPIINFRRTKRPQFLTLFILVIILLPLLNFFNAWDSYLSFSLYSGKVDNYYILSKNDFSEQNVFSVKDYFVTKNDTQQGEILHLNNWAFSVLNVPMVPEKRAFKKIAKSFCSGEQNKSNFIFVTTKLPLWKLQNSIEENSANYVDQILFFNFDNGIEKDAFEYFICNDIYNDSK